MAELETEQEMSRSDVATYLREFADKLDANEGHAGTESTDRSETSSADATRDSDETDAESRETDDATREIREDETGSGERTDGERTNEDRTSEGSHEIDRHEMDGQTSGHGERVTFMVGNESATINPPRTVEFRMAVDSDSAMLDSGARETVEFALHWDTDNVTDDDTLDIQ
ncbi:amphi-Trp domain-containing protein [Halococcus agarilyticus]|uniref:amphi-Trp domain-containing protein n=1 Tax=Halococcus agarilyticus TaxID=1232219 RepID=UPI0006775B77|nr:amphi-Trp domain-containing protein [Halococcus agarilyticus]